MHVPPRKRRDRDDDRRFAAALRASDRSKKRPAASAGAAAPASAAPAAASLRLSEPAERLRAAAAIRDRLLAQVGKRKAALDKAQSLARDTAAHVSSVVEPKWQALHQLDDELHQLFSALLEDPSRSKRDRQALRRLLQSLQQRGMISMRREPPRQRGRGRRPGEDEGEADDWSQRGPSHRGPIEDDFTPQGDVASAARPRESQHGGLRSLFRRLVEAFHPDKVQDEREKAHRTEVMKDITAAYRRGDLARLLELERDSLLQAVDPLDALAALDDAESIERRLAALDRSCDELRDQLQELDRTIRAVRRSPQSRMAKDLARAKRAGIELVDFDAIRELDKNAATLRRARDLCASYREGAITLAQLLTSPPLVDPDDDDELLDLVTQLAAEMLERERERAAHHVGRRPPAREEPAPRRRQRR